MKRKNVLVKAMALAMAAVMTVSMAACGTDDEEETKKNVSEKSTTSSEEDSVKKTDTDEKADSDEETSDDETKETDEETSAETDTTSEGESTEENTDGKAANTGNSNESGNENNSGNTGGSSNTENGVSGSTGNSGTTNNGSNTGSTGNSGNTGTTNTGSTGTGGSTAATVNTGTAIKNRVSVHDPSIVVGKDKSGNKCYYIFGSHLAWAKSYDLQNWSTFTNNINSSYNTLFASAFDWANNGDSVYKNSGNMWAPDVIWNPYMNKWCMYMSINGCSWNSSIVLLTADSLEGNWTYVGPVIYSGFTSSGTYSYTQTDYIKAVGNTDGTEFLNDGRYYKNPYQCSDGNTKCEATTWNSTTGAHAIDPCVVFDKNGDLYMSYGSWSGGIWMIKLDKTTGLRDYTKAYGTSDLTNATEDPYMGKKIAGATGATGEASYIVYDSSTDYYYLYVTYGGLTANGGYHIRLFRSKSIDGTYVDYDGTRANARGGNRDGIGIKLFGNYYFSSLSTNTANAQKGYKSGGHNSAFIDDDGSHYLIYHTRFNLGNEWHNVRVHQQFVNEDGWLVTAVYEYLGSKISTTGYSMDDMAGTYELVNMGTSSAISNVGMLSNGSLTLNSNGTISGTYSGTWSYNKQYVTLNIGGTAYKGVFFKQYDESSTHKEVMTFTVIGADTSLWGTK